MNGMTPVILVLSALACVLLALALWLFHRARHKETQESIHSNMQRSLDIQRDLRASSAPLPMPGALPLDMQAKSTTQPTGLLQWMDEHLGFGAWGVTPRALAIIAASGLLLVLLAGLRGGAIAGLAALALLVLLFSFVIWLRVNRRRAKMLSQLPGFLDNMVRLISIGNSPHAAFQLASSNVPEPLGGALQHVTAALSVSPDLGQAMAQLERTWGLEEFGLLAAVFRMSTRYGGRADLVLERVSTYIRDRQSAERELHALSAEVRLSAWILALLPTVVGALIMTLNEGYFLRMWTDPFGRKLIIFAAALQVFGSFLLYRLARLK